MEKKPEFHGSDLEKIASYYHMRKEDIICYSANVNPLGLSEKVKSQLAANLDVITRYPDRDYTSLRETIGAYCHADPGHIMVGNGSTELISLLISQLSPRKALVLGPTYSEYARELSLIGGALQYYHLKESQDFVLDIPDFLQALTDDIGLVILCNPNNPTSSAIHQADMERIIGACKKKGIFVMIDETYAEFAPDPSDITAIPLASRYDNFMVIRGVTKFFASPGLRFGYGITGSKELLSALLLHQNPWSLNSIGAYAGELMLKDSAYIQATWNLIDSERTRVCQELNAIEGLKIYKPYANFVLIRILKDGLTSFDLFEAAIHENLMIRDCSSFETLEGEYIRFCFLMPQENGRLLDCLKRALKARQ